MHIAKIGQKSDKFPPLLKQINGPPSEIFVIGDYSLLTAPAVAIVGSRRPTAYGQDISYRLAYELAKAGLVIISGLAIGIDAVAHRGALEAEGKTVAVLGNGIDSIQPPSNRALGERIKETGAIVSEYAPGIPASIYTFPERNRIIAGLSLAVIVTEANAESGALITANFGLQNNRLVMAVPGNITSPRSAGPNNLLKSGAIPVLSSSDVLAALDYKIEDQAPIKGKSREETVILELIGQGINATQDLIEQSELSAARFAQVISLMEISGKVRNLGAGQWSLGR